MRFECCILIARSCLWNVNVNLETDVSCVACVLLDLGDLFLCTVQPHTLLVLPSSLSHLELNVRNVIDYMQCQVCSSTYQLGINRGVQ
jgi:hypothetical protein